MACPEIYVLRQGVEKTKLNIFVMLFVIVISPEIKNQDKNYFFNESCLPSWDLEGEGEFNPDIRSDVLGNQNDPLVIT